jgi:hypothetical protein
MPLSPRSGQSPEESSFEPKKERRHMSIWSDLVIKIVNPVLVDTNKLIRLVALIFAICLAIGGGIGLLMKSLPAKSDIIVPWGKSEQIIFERHASEYETEYVVVIHPQGWQETGIQVKKGDTLRLSSDGSVAIDLQGLVTSVNRRSKLEARAKRTTPPIKWNQLLPERQWTPDETTSIMPKRAWTGPDGYTYDPQDTDFVARTNNKIMPNERYGALLMAFSPTGKIPSSSQARLAGTEGTFQIPCDGKVWFVVNDVWDDQDPLFPNKFYIDNIGQFYAKVSVTKKSRK